MIKLFEEYNQYYTKIDYQEYIQPEYLNQFSEEETNSIHKLLNHRLKMIDKGYNVDIMISDDSFHDITYLKDSKFIKWEKWMSIDKSPDEWYYVYVLVPDLEFYKCDQLEGLLQFIQDKKEKIF